MVRMVSDLLRQTWFVALCIIVSPVYAGDAIYRFDSDMNRAVWERPAHFYHIKESTDKVVCANVLAKLNEPYKSETFPQDGYSGFFVNNSATLKWRERTEGSYSPVYFIRYGENNPVWIYKTYMSVSGKEISFLSFQQQSVDDKKMDDEALKTYLFSKPFVAYARQSYASIPESNNMGNSETSLIALDETKQLLALSGEASLRRLCGKHYEIFAFQTGEKQYQPPACHFVSNAKILCQNQ